MTTEQQKNEKAKVEEKLFGQVKLEIYRRDGDFGTFHRGEIFAIYTDKEGNWKSTKSFKPHQAEQVAHAASHYRNWLELNAPEELEVRTEQKAA